MILEQSLIALAIAGVTVVIHAGFMVAAERLFPGIADGGSGQLRKALAVAAIVVWFMLSIITQCWVWALTMVWLGALGTTEESLYFTVVTFTTLGYGDVVLDGRWRLLGAFAATNGTIIIGWTTALVFLAVQRIYLDGDRP